jgi:hypothetical protein
MPAADPVARSIGESLPSTEPNIGAPGQRENSTWDTLTDHPIAMAMERFRAGAPILLSRV